MSIYVTSRGTFRNYNTDVPPVDITHNTTYNTFQENSTSPFGFDLLTSGMLPSVGL